MHKRLMAGLLTVLALGLVGCASDGTAASGEHEVVYSITSDGTSSTSISYTIVTGADVSLAQATGETLPWRRTVNIPDGAFSTSILNLAGQLGQTGTTITCDISVDGESVASQTSTGQFAAVTCKGTDQESGAQ
jgi:hypothetical protein